MDLETEDPAEVEFASAAPFEERAPPSAICPAMNRHSSRSASHDTTAGPRAMPAHAAGSVIHTGSAHKVSSGSCTTTYAFP